MPVSLLHNDQLRPLMAGLAYMLLCALGSGATRSLRSWLERTSDPGVLRVCQWRAWPSLGQAVRLAFAIAFPFSMLLVGVFSASDVGVQRANWGDVLPQVLAATGGAAAWLSLLWCAYLRKRPRTTDLLGSNRGTWASTLADALRSSADAATYRAGLMPLLGSYWGVWMAIAWKLLASLTRAELRARLRTPAKREYIFLEWALDWVDAILYTLSGSALAALFGRAACLLTVTGIARRACRWRGRSRSARSTHDQGQDHQSRKHGSGHNGDTLQIT